MVLSGIEKWLRTMAWAGLLIGSACTAETAREVPVDPSGRLTFERKGSSAHADLARRFVSALIDRRFDDAHGLLSMELADAYDQERLKAAYLRLVAGVPGPLSVAEVVGTMAAWPDRRDGDLGWVHVPISGFGDGRGLNVIVAATDDGPRVRKVEWGFRQQRRLGGGRTSSAAASRY